MPATEPPCLAIVAYTGRALAGLAAAVRRGAVPPGMVTVFVHTGGLPGLFGHGLGS